MFHVKQRDEAGRVIDFFICSQHGNWMSKSDAGATRANVPRMEQNRHSAELRRRTTPPSPSHHLGQSAVVDVSRETPRVTEASPHSPGLPRTRPSRATDAAPGLAAPGHFRSATTSRHCHTYGRSNVTPNGTGAPDSPTDSAPGEPTSPQHRNPRRRSPIASESKPGCCHGWGRVPCPIRTITKASQ